MLYSNISVLRDMCFTTKCVGFPGGSVVKNPPANVGDMVLIPGSGNPCRRKWQPTSVFLPGKSHGQRGHGILQEQATVHGVVKVRHNLATKQLQQGQLNV